IFSFILADDELNKDLLNTSLKITPRDCPDFELGLLNGYVALIPGSTSEISKVDDKLYNLKVSGKEVAQHSGNKAGLKSSKETKAPYWNIKPKNGAYSLKSSKRKWIGKQYCLTYFGCNQNQILNFEVCRKDRKNQLFNIKPVDSTKDDDPFASYPKPEKEFNSSSEIEEESPKNEERKKSEETTRIEENPKSGEEPKSGEILKSEEPKNEEEPKEESFDECDSNIPSTTKKVIVCEQKNKPTYPKKINVPAYYYTNTPQYPSQTYTQPASMYSPNTIPNYQSLSNLLYSLGYNQNYSGNNTYPTTNYNSNSKNITNKKFNYSPKNTVDVSNLLRN
ncbi:hypothetical protein TUBRATIS_30190, partial [Tubulinosema ratisbonensis]